MIEIKVKLVRSDSAIYATGERVECLIEFIHKCQNNEEILENLAWATVQLHCYRKTSYAITSTDKINELTELVGKTALDAVTQTPGDIIIATKPKILFCDLKLQPNESKIYFFNEVIPRDGPPTYRGHNIKYFYKLTIATQRVKSKVQTLTVPIRVLPIPFISRPDELPGTEETNEELTPTNPFLHKREVTELETSWHYLKNLTARRAPKFYRISNKHGFVGRFCLFKPCYKLGEDIVGSLDFTEHKVRCVQYCVKLQSQEILVHGVQTHTTGSSASSVDLNDAASLRSVDLASIVSGTGSFEFQGKSSKSHNLHKDVDEPSGKLTTHATHHEVCFAALQTQVIIPIPLHVTPSFRTDLVDVRWRLHFEFVTTTLMDFGKPNPIEGELIAPAELPVETMVWDLPITLYSANPLQIYAPSQINTLLIK